MATKTRTLERGPRRDAVASARYLFLVLQAAHPTSGSSRHALDDLDELVIGRGRARTWRRTVERGTRRLRIDVPDDWMSTAHVRLRVLATRILVADADSKNGTLVNGRPIASAELADGDVIQAGRTLVCFRAALVAPPGAAADVDSETLPGVAGLRTLLPDLGRRFLELATIAPSPAPILVLGQTGTGKELVARAVHALSKRTGPFVAVNCGALAPSLVESELFGHRKGAFSGATADRVGLVEASAGGTLFLDELGEIPERVQVALLRVLQEKEVTPVGANRPVPVDLRVVAATNRDVGHAIEAGILREDLVARLRGYELELPPLTRRVPDLGIVIGELLRRLAPDRGDALELDIEAASALVMHAWPRNIRELERCLEVALALAGSSPISASHVQLEAPPTAPAVVDDPRRAELVGLLTEHAGNISAVAEAMGKKRQQIQKWLKKFAIDPDRFR